MKRFWLTAVIHSLFWGSTAWLLLSSYSVISHEVDFIDGIKTVKIVRSYTLLYQILLCIIVSLVLFYVNAWKIFSLNKHLYTNISVGYSGLMFIIALFIVYGLVQLGKYRQEPPLPIQIAFGVVTFYFALSCAWGLAKLWLFSQERNQKLVLDKKQTELSLLRNHLQPHFLFNALNNLLSMVNPSDSPKLVASFERLSQLLRYVVEETNAEKVTVAKEIHFLKNYIELQLLRFSDDEVDVSFNVYGDYDDQKVEPGLLIAFVENAFKYGTEPEKTSAIDITFDISKPNTIDFHIKNEIRMKNTQGAGTGIENTRKRLALIYPGKHKLSVSASGFFIVHINIMTL